MVGLKWCLAIDKANWLVYLGITHMALGFSVMQTMHHIQYHISQDRLGFTAITIITKQQKSVFHECKVCCGSGSAGLPGQLFSPLSIPSCFILWHFHIKMCSHNHLTGKGLVNPLLEVNASIGKWYMSLSLTFHWPKWVRRSPLTSEGRMCTPALRLEELDVRER